MFFCECAHCYRAQNVALHAESVDRKFKTKAQLAAERKVALHAESVDRKDNVICKEISRDVALHAESVDRKIVRFLLIGKGKSRSPCGERG